MWRCTSEKDRQYNCVGFALGFRMWIWPESDFFGPRQKPANLTVTEFIEVFRDICGFEQCASELYEEGYLKVALYASEAGIPTHVARQLPSAKWTSKLSDGIDIEHDTLGDLPRQPFFDFDCCAVYGVWWS
jgi:hypothetical protein